MSNLGTNLHNIDNCVYNVHATAPSGNGSLARSINLRQDATIQAEYSTARTPQACHRSHEPIRV